MKKLAPAGAVMFLTSCGGTGSSTSLTLVATNPVVGRATLHLSCDPARGTFPRPRAACLALAREPALLSHPKPFTCAGGLFSWWDNTVTGRLRGKPVDLKTSTCWARQMHLLDSLEIGSWP